MMPRQSRGESIPSLQLTVTRPVTREYAQPGSRQQLNAGRYASTLE